MGKKYEPVDLSKIKTYPLSERKNLVKVGDFGKVGKAGASFKGFLDSLPDILATRDFRAVVEAIVSARRKNKPVVFAMGAHVIKCGLNPIVIDLVKKGVITAVAMHGAGMVHDVEVALIGETSEDVQEGLKRGTFGMVKETGEVINEAINEGVQRGLGIGEAVGKKLIALNPPHLEHSILAASVRMDIPVTVHVAIGTDITHTHPNVDGAALGKGSLTDFCILTSVVSDLRDGGVYLNVGSAVILPEVFLKALTAARNLGHRVENFTTVNMDFIQHYRPCQNVVKRPTTEPGSKGYALTGHHEIMIPLLAQAVLEELG
ncbi:MAG: hypothetical protein QMD08_02065 [Actinomycetota bacterium]|nr:hypothetical protein [Actinomycetota bacterium]